MSENNDRVSLANFTLPEIPRIRDYRLADWMYERIIKRIEDFEKNLPDDMQAGGMLANFANMTFSIDDIGYHNPDMIIFYGTQLDGSKIELLQHTSQLNLLLVGVKRSNPEEPRRKIGFIADDE